MNLLITPFFRRYGIDDEKRLPGVAPFFPLRIGEPARLKICPTVLAAGEA